MTESQSFPEGFLSEKEIPKIHWGILYFREKLIARKLKLEQSHPQISFYYKKIVWDESHGFELNHHAYGTVQYTIRPYVQGYGCDGTTDENIHLITKEYCLRRKWNYNQLYLKAYNWKKEDSSQYNLIREHVESSDKLEEIKHETIIPDKINPHLLIHDLREINNYSVADVLEDKIHQQEGIEIKY